jgi:hypothetical protein
MTHMLKIFRQLLDPTRVGIASPRSLMSGAAHIPKHKTILRSIAWVTIRGARGRAPSLCRPTNLSSVICHLSSLFSCHVDR